MQTNAVRKEEEEESLLPTCIAPGVPPSLYVFLRGGLIVSSSSDNASITYTRIPSLLVQKNSDIIKLLVISNLCCGVFYSGA